MRRVEAYEVRRRVRAREGVLGGIADREDRAGAVGAAPQLAEHVARPPIDANAQDALERERLLEPGHLEQLALRGDEEAHAGAADARLRRDLLAPERLAERGRD